VPHLGVGVDGELDEVPVGVGHVQALADVMVEGHVDRAAAGLELGLRAGEVGSRVADLQGKW
jgi:hypothetical protein